MRVSARLLRALALFLAVAFLAAQFHFCVDVSSGPSGSHICPVCSAAGSAMVTHAVTFDPVLHVNRFEEFSRATAPSVEAFLSLSSRAPPSL
jgi:hypothetical protein